jgi:hypothetical protein
MQMIKEEEESNEQKHKQIEQQYDELSEYLASRQLGKCGHCHIKNVLIVAILHMI